MRKHYFEFNDEEKELSELGKYDFKYGLDGGYRYYLHENCYNSRKNQWLNIWVNAFGKISAWLEWSEWGEPKTEHLSFRKLKRYIKKNLTNLLKDRIFIEVVETKYGDKYVKEN